jgi:hypothetical protein
LGLCQQVSEVFGKTSGDWLATAQTASNLQLGYRDVVAKRRLPAHGSTCRSLPSSVIV